MQPKDRAITKPIATEPALSPTQTPAGEEPRREDPLTDEARRAAEVLIRHLLRPRSSAWTGWSTRSLISWLTVRSAATS